MTKIFQSKEIFLDTASSMPVLKEVQEYLLGTFAPESFQNFGWNLDGQHKIGFALYDRYQEELHAFLSRFQIAPIEWYWTSGATESNNWALAILEGQKRICHLVLHPLLHSSLEKAALRVAKTKNWTYEYLDLSGIQTQRYQDLQKTRSLDTVAYLSSWGDNEMGVYDEKMKNIARFFHEGGAWVHLDLAQSFAKQATDLRSLPCSSAAISAHKIGALCGLGALYLKISVQNHIPSIFVGGRQQFGKRAGTLPLLLIHAFFKAVEAWTKKDTYHQHCCLLSSQIETYVLQRDWLSSLSPSQSQDRLSHIYTFMILSENAQKKIATLKDHRFAFSQASTCHLGQPSPALLRYGLSAVSQKNLIRLSVGPSNTEQEIRLFFEILDR